jgi:hypothetical protein
VTALSMGFNVVPIVDVASKWVFAAKVAATALLLNGVGMGAYWKGTRHRIEEELEEIAE